MSAGGPDPLSVSCDDCGSAAGLVCWSRPADGEWRTRAPHPSRVAKARAAAAERAAVVSDSDRRLAIALLIQRSGPTDLAAIHDLLLVRKALPHGVDGLVRVLKHGANKHNGGQLGIAPGVTADDCAEHMAAHADRAWETAARDPETGELDAAHAAARGIMLAELVASGEVTRG